MCPAATIKAKGVNKEWVEGEEKPYCYRGTATWCTAISPFSKSARNRRKQRPARILQQWDVEATPLLIFYLPSNILLG